MLCSKQYASASKLGGYFASMLAVYFIGPPVAWYLKFDYDAITKTHGDWQA